MALGFAARRGFWIQTSLFVLCVPAGLLIYIALNGNDVRFLDRYFWPTAAASYLDDLAAVRKSGLATGISSACHAGAHPANLLADESFRGAPLTACMRTITPATDVKVTVQPETVRRIWRGYSGDLICELNASAWRYDDRPTGWDCGMALFHGSADPGLGVASNVDGG